MIKKRVKKYTNKFSFSWTFFIAFLFSFFAGNGYIFLLYTIAVLLHELIHILVAVKLGYTLQKFTLSILGASMNLEDESFFGFDEFIIAISGPIFNLLLFIICLGAWWVFPESYNFTFDFALVNLFVFAINILPIFSLDGGRIIVALLSRKWDRKKAVNFVKIIGIIFACIFFLLFLVSFFFEFNFSLGVIAIFLFSSCTKSGGDCYKKISVVSKKNKLKNNLSLQLNTFIFSCDARLIHLYRKLKSNTFTSFCVVNNQKAVTIDEDKLFLLLEKFGFNSRLCDCNIF